MENANILEIGAGYGGILAYFQNQGHQVRGCDLSSEAVEYANSRGVPMQHGPLDEIDLDWQPDVVILSHVLEHLVDPSETLADLRQLLHDDSIVYIEVPGIKQLSPVRTYYDSDFMEYIHIAHPFCFSARSLTNLTNVSGFSPLIIDESIKSIFIPSETSGTIRSDYEDVITHLDRLEFFHRYHLHRSGLLSPHRNERFISLLKKMGLYPPAKRLYRFITNS